MKIYQLFTDEPHNHDAHQCDLYIGENLEKMNFVLQRELKDQGYMWGDYYLYTWKSGKIIKKEVLYEENDSWIEYTE